MHFYYCTLCSVTLVALSGSCCRVRLEWDGRVIAWAWLALISVTCPLWFILLPNKPVYGLHFNCYFVIALHVQPSSALPFDIEGLFSKPAESKKHGKELNFLHQEQERQDNRSLELPPPPYKKKKKPFSSESITPGAASAWRLWSRAINLSPGVRNAVKACAWTQPNFQTYRKEVLIGETGEIYQNEPLINEREGLAPGYLISFNSKLLQSSPSHSLTDHQDGRPCHPPTVEQPPTPPPHHPPPSAVVRIFPKCLITDDLSPNCRLLTGPFRSLSPRHSPAALREPSHHYERAHLY